VHLLDQELKIINEAEKFNTAIERAESELKSLLDYK
jgi:hypothetical protein